MTLLATTQAAGIYPELHPNIGKRGKLKDPDGSVYEFTIIDEVRKVQSHYSDGGTLPRKTLVLQRIQFDSGDIELRLGYYIIGRSPGVLGRWIWGQYATLIPEQDLTELLSAARERGWLF